MFDPDARKRQLRDRPVLARIALRAIRSGFQLPRASDLGRFRELCDLRDMLLRERIDCVLDVGANIGQFGSDLRGIGYQGWIVSFEPASREFSALQRKLDDRWIAYPYALTDTDGKREFFINRESVFNSFHRLVGRSETTATEVETRRLDGLFAEIDTRIRGVRYFLKLDTQGADLDVVVGAEQCLDHIVAIQSEISVRPLYRGIPGYLDALRTYEGLGYRLQSLHEVSRDDCGAVVEYNCLLLRGASPVVGSQDSSNAGSVMPPVKGAR